LNKHRHTSDQHYQNQYCYSNHSSGKRKGSIVLDRAFWQNMN
jgi:acyl-ACP thioesterase